jgi:Lon protease-like protein
MDESRVCELDRKSLMPMLQAYFRCQGLSANWESIESVPDEKLVTTLAMICPFGPTDKQALLEAATVSDRARIMTALMQMAVVDGGEQSCH